MKRVFKIIDRSKEKEESKIYFDNSEPQEEKPAKKSKKKKEPEHEPEPEHIEK